MNNLYRELAPISAAAWADLEQEARRTFGTYVAGRRIVDVDGPDGPTLAAVNTGRLGAVDAPADGVVAHLRQSQPLVRLRVPFTLSRDEIDAVERGAQDADWQPLKDAARQIGFAEDRAIFEGYAAAGITGLRAASTNPALDLPADPTQYPDVVVDALTRLRLAGVNGPYALVLSTAAYDAISVTTEHGYPIRRQVERVFDGEILWAPAIDGAFLLSTRGGDYTLSLGQDLSIGYLSHDTDRVQLYFQESLTFLAYTSEAIVAVSPAAAVTRP
ncbi:MAG TPA: family 1 encapsulin nanocompartment shell protein [Streptosporangiaceae bacterium]